MYEQICGLNGYMDRGECVDAQMGVGQIVSGWIDERQMNGGQVITWMSNRWVYKEIVRMDGWMDRWMDGWMDGCREREIYTKRN